MNQNPTRNINYLHHQFSIFTKSKYQKISDQFPNQSKSIRAKMSDLDKTLHQQFSRYGKNAKEWLNKCILLLPHIERNRVWEKKGFFSIYEYAAKLAGMSHEKVNEGLRIIKSAHDKPALMKVIEEKGINAVKPVVTIATKETDEFWAKKAKDLSKNTLEMYVREFRKSGLDSEEKNKKTGLPRKAENAENPQIQAILNLENCMSGNKGMGKTGDNEMADENCSENKGEMNALFIELKPEVKEKLEKLRGNKSWNDLMEQFLELQEKEIKRLRKEAHEKFAEIKNSQKRQKRPMPVVIGKYVLAKTNNQCAFPGCSKPCDVRHHVKRFSLFPEHNPEKIIPLCREHHQLAHTGLIKNEEMETQFWQVRKEEDINDIKILVDNRVREFRK